MIAGPSAIVRIIICYFPWIPMMSISWLLSFFSKKHTMVRGKIYNTMRLMQMMVSRLILMILACWPGMMHEEHVKIDYRKYLGPDWKPTNKSPTAIISNH